MEWILGGIAVIGEGLNLFGKIKEMKEKNRQINTALGNLDESYNQAVKQNKESYDLGKEQLTQSYELNTGIVKDNQQRNAQQSSKLIVDSDAIQLANVATLQVEGAQAEGQAMQQVALSGFRDTGSAMNIYNDTARNNRNVIEKALMQRSLSNVQSYYSALNNYIDANQQLEKYRLTYEQTNKEMDMQYSHNVAKMKMDKEHQEEELRAGIFTGEDFTFTNISGGFNIAADIFSAYAKYKE